MSRFSVRSFGAAVVAVAVLCSMGALAAQNAPAPGPAPAAGAAAAGLTPAQAAPFMGDWSISADSQMGPITFSVTIKVDQGKVVADVSSDQQPKLTVTDVSKADKSLVLRYSFDYQGNDVPVEITLTPAGDKVNADFDFAGGAFTMSGTAVKKSAA